MKNLILRIPLIFIPIYFNIHVNSAARITAVSEEAQAKIECDELIAASYLGNIDTVKKIIESGVDVNTFGTFKNIIANKVIWDATALIAATAAGNIEIVRYLLNANADTEQIDILKDTALVKAVRYGYQDIVQLLLDNGANITYNPEHEATIENTWLDDRSNTTILFLDDKKDEGCAYWLFEIYKPSTNPFTKDEYSKLVLISNNYCTFDEKIKKLLIKYEHNTLIKTLIKIDNNFGDHLGPLSGGIYNSAGISNQSKLAYFYSQCISDTSNTNRKYNQPKSIKIIKKILKLLKEEPKRREAAQKFRKEKIIETLVNNTQLPNDLILLIDSYLPESTLKESLHDFINVKAR